MAADIQRGLAVVALLHRAPQPHAAFAGLVGGRWRNLFALGRSELLNPEFTAGERAALESDIYVSLNGMRPATGKSRAMPFKRRQAGKRRNDSVMALNAVWVDLDTYTCGLSPADALGRLRPLAEQGQLPPWSLEIHSGRGLWLLWLLRADADTDLPPEATASNKDAFRRINRALADQLGCMGADRNAMDLARVARLPFTRNGKAVANGLDGTVRWELANPLPAYTLAELTAAIVAGRTESRPERRGLPAGRRAWVDRGTHSTKRAPRGAPFTPGAGEEAARRRWGLPLLDLLHLAFYRGGYGRGHRHFAVFWIAHLLTLALPSEPGKLADIYRICLELNADCSEPLSDGQVKRQVRQGTSWKPAGYVTNGSLTDRFDITAEEGALLRKLKPRAIRRREARRDFVCAAWNDWIEAKGSPPTLDELTREVALTEAPSSRATIARTLRALGYHADAAARSPARRSAERKAEKTSAKNETVIRQHGKRGRRA